MKRIVVALLVFTMMIFSINVYGAVFEKKEAQKELTFIVEIEGEPALVRNEADLLGVDFLETETAQAAEEQILSYQAQVRSTITEKTKATVDEGFTYTTVFNGFSAKGTKEDLEKIKKISGVKNVYISPDIPISEYLTSSAGMINALPEQTATQDVPNGYTGKGQIVAIIDSEFDINHTFFEDSVNSPKYTKEEMLLKISEAVPEVTASQACHNEKILFAYDYAQKDYDVYSDNAFHGSHVAGIIGGNKGVDFEGNAFCGVAPDAQLLLMKYSDPKSDVSILNTLLAALDDAVQLGAVAVNMSFGFNYASVDEQMLQPIITAINNAEAAGVSVVVAAGNEANAYHNKKPYTTHADYSVAGVPEAIASSFAVGSAANEKIWLKLGVFELSDESEVYYHTNAQSSDSFYNLFKDEEQEYVYVGYGGKFSDYQDTKNKIALIDCIKPTNITNQVPSLTKINMAKSAGAKGAILIFTSEIDETILARTAIHGTNYPIAFVMPKDREKICSLQDKTFFVKPEKTRHILLASGGVINDFSSFGVAENLELKPEITAPGGNILSVAPGNNGFATISGTSMAAPHITGAIALMNELLDKNGCELTGKERTSHIENLLMSTAVPCVYRAADSDNSTPYSPRVQGAGLVNVGSAVKTKVILTDGNGETKLSLGNDITKGENTFSFTFEIENFGDEEIIFDNNKLFVSADEYSQADNNKFIVTGNPAPLTMLGNTLEKTISVLPQSTKEISVQVTLSQDQLDEYRKIFTNGFFIDGFVSLTSTEEKNPAVGIPFTGFCGDWTASSIYDATVYDEETPYLAYQDEDGITYGTYLFSTMTMDDDVYTMILGGNYDSDSNEVVFNKDAIAISPNGDNAGDIFGINLYRLRSTKGTEFAIFNSNNEEVITVENDETVVSKYIVSDYEIEGVDELTEGEYTLKVTSCFNYEGAKSESLLLPFIVDTTYPTISDLMVIDNKLTFKAKDENFLTEVYFCYTDENGENTEELLYMNGKKGEEFNVTYDLTDINCDGAYIKVSDSAMNFTTYDIDGINGDIQMVVESVQANENETSIVFNVKNSHSDSLTATIVTAFYDESNKLIAVNTDKDQEISSGQGTYTLEADINTKTATRVKVFLLKNTENLSPLDKAKIFSYEY